MNRAVAKMGEDANLLPLTRQVTVAYNKAMKYPNPEKMEMGNVDQLKGLVDTTRIFKADYDNGEKNLKFLVEDPRGDPTNDNPSPGADPDDTQEKPRAKETAPEQPTNTQTEDSSISEKLDALHRDILAMSKQLKDTQKASANLSKQMETVQDTVKTLASKFEPAEKVGKVGITDFG
jgi:hypothetical protein